MWGSWEEQDYLMIFARWGLFTLFVVNFYSLITNVIHSLISLLERSESCLLSPDCASCFHDLLFSFFFLCVLTGELPVVNSTNDQKHVLAKVSQQAVYDSEKKPSGYLAQLEPYGLSASQEQMAINWRKRLPPPALSRECWPNWQIKHLAS